MARFMYSWLAVLQLAVPCWPPIVLQKLVKQSVGKVLPLTVGGGILAVLLPEQDCGSIVKAVFDLEPSVASYAQYMKEARTVSTRGLK